MPGGGLMPVKVTLSGPLFDGRAQRVLNELPDDIAKALGEEGKRRVLSGLDATLRKPTGAYRKRITLYGPVGGQARVHDQMGIYGPWLEGTGKRNRTTRFKGYRNFRNTLKTLRSAAKPLSRDVIARRLPEMGG